jgi:hypothetical protein
MVRKNITKIPIEYELQDESFKQSLRDIFKTCPGGSSKMYFTKDRWRLPSDFMGHEERRTSIESRDFLMISPHNSGLRPVRLLLKYAAI